MKEQNREITEIERMAIDIDKLFYEAEIKQILPKKHPSIVKAEALYNAGYRKQEWISVDDRLPDIEGSVRTWGDLRIQPSVRVLCACKQKSGKVFVKEGYCEMWGSRVVWKIPGTVDSVTHWMPLPQPPKMKGDAE